VNAFCKVRVVALAILIALQVPALPLVAKYLYPTSRLLAVAAPIVNVAAAAAIIRSPLMRKRWVWPTILIVATVAVAIVYPIAEAHRPGSDSDDCVIMLTQNCLHGQYPYVTHTSYLGQPCRDGPGELLLYAPLVALNLFQFGAPLALFFLALMYASVSGVEATNILFVLLFSTVVTWQHLVTATDYLTIGSIIVICLVGLWKNERAWWYAIVLGAAASARVIFLFIPIIAGLLIWRRGRRQAAIVTTLGLLVGTVPTVLLYLWSPADFTPADVFEAGLVWIASPTQRVIGAVLGIAAGLLVLKWSRTRSLAGWCGMLALVMILPMAVASFGQLQTQMHWQLSRWAGGYLMFGVPALCAWAVLQDAPAGANAETQSIEDRATPGQKRPMR
jgi:hypothetical protein